ncbi:MAG: serine protease [Gemmatimonadota bacterium]
MPIRRLDRLPRLLAACTAGIAPVACGGPLPVAGGLGGHAYYQTAFPAYDTSEILGRTFESVKRIQTTAIYETYTFAPNDAPTEGEVGEPDILRSAVDTTSFPHERAATAVVLSSSSGNVALLTANHALEFPDRIIQFFDDENGRAGAAARPPGSRLVESISIKTHQTNWLLGATLEPFEVLERDPIRDLALIGVREPLERTRAGPIPGIPLEERARRIQVLSLPAGESQRLSWGSFVYVIGYPKGYPMVTRGIVSTPDERTSGTFLVDGLWNRGSSGGLILAVRGDGRGLEWVGMARGAAATTEIRLVPEERTESPGGVRRPYEGRIFLEEYRGVDYGITFSVPMHEIRRFLNERRPALAQRGFVLPRL